MGSYDHNCRMTMFVSACGACQEEHSGRDEKFVRPGMNDKTALLKSTCLLSPLEAIQLLSAYGNTNSAVFPSLEDEIVPELRTAGLRMVQLSLFLAGKCLRNNSDPFRIQDTTVRAS